VSYILSYFTDVLMSALYLYHMSYCICETLSS